MELPTNYNWLKRGLLYWIQIIGMSCLILIMSVSRVLDSRFSLVDLITTKYLVRNGIHLLMICVFTHKAVEVVKHSPVAIGEKIVIWMLTLFFTAFSLLAKYFEGKTEESIAAMLHSVESKIYFALAACGGLLVIYFSFRIIWEICGSGYESKPFGTGRLAAFFGKHMYRNCMVVMFILWLPQYIIRFPGVMTYDGWHSLALYFGTTPMTTQHPLIWIVPIGKLTELGLKMGIPWLMPVVVCILQHLVSMLAICYVLDTIKNLGFSEKYLAIVFLFFAMLPSVQLYASTVYNDLFYSLAIMVITAELVWYLYNREAFFMQARHKIVMASAVFATIVRYNGWYTMLAVSIVVIVRELCLTIRKKAKVQHALVMAFLLLLPLFCGQFVQNSLNIAYGARSVSSRAMLAMPIQQSARCLKELGDKIPQDIYDDIHAVMTWSDEEISENYNPKNFDGVKDCFKTDASSEELTAFIKAWIKLVIRYPDICFMAMANQNYNLFSPFAENVRYYESFSKHTEKALSVYGYDPTDLLDGVAVFDEECEALLNFYKFTHPDLPVLGQTVNNGVYIVLLFGISLCLLFRKDRRALVLTVSMFATMGIVFVGPALYNHPRYLFPIMFSMPLLIAAFMVSGTEKLGNTL